MEQHNTPPPPPFNLPQMEEELQKEAELPEGYEIDPYTGEPRPISKALNSGKNSALQQGAMIPSSWRPTADQPLPVVRCTAKVKNGPREGERCGRWSIAGATVCIVHGGRLPNVREAAAQRVETAKMRLIADSDKAIDTLFELIAPGTQDNVRLGAAKEILDRAGIKGGADMTVEVNHNVSYAEEIEKRLASIRERLEPSAEEDVLDVEIDSEQ